MNKCKISKSAGFTRLIIKGLKGQQVSERELYSINSNEVPGLLHLDVVKKSSKFKLQYDITGFISLKKYLKEPIDKESFGRILRRVLDVFKNIQDVYFNPQTVLLDFRYVMVNLAAQNLFFVYAPVQPFENNGTLRDFLLNIIRYCSFVPGEDTEYVKEYISILNDGVNFSVFELEQYINGLLLDTDDEATPGQKECPKCHSTVTTKTPYCSFCGTKLSGNSGNLKKLIYDLNSNSEDLSPPKPINKISMVKSTDTEIPNTPERPSPIEGTTVLGVEKKGTTVLGSGELDSPSYPYLIREKNDEKILVNKPAFRIGKEKQYCDYFVFDNNSISRSHADIITQNSRYYIVDLNSTNKTYVEDKAIPAKQKVEIFSGTRLRLANEQFTFNIEI